MAKPSKTWDFTVNNYTDEDLRLLEQWSTEVNRGVASKEVGENGTPHIQGRITFKRAYRFTGVKKLAPSWHWEITIAAADSLYAMKQGGELFWNVDNRQQGHRTDLDSAVEIVKSNVGNSNVMKRVAEECPREFVKFHKGFEALANALVEPRDAVPTVRVWVGETGSGKSRSAREWLGKGEHYTWTPALGTWFDGYMGHSKVLFEEFRGQISLGEMLVLLDRYDAKVQVKGGVREFVGVEIGITSPKHPRDWYPNCANDKIEQLLRRITEIIIL